MSNVLALGGAGFIGSYVTRELLKRGHTVTVVDNYSKYGQVEHDFYADPHCTVVAADVRSLGAVDFAGYSHVLCLAALIGGIQYFHRIPYRIARDNTEILAHAIDMTLEGAPESTFVYFSSSMVYERADRPVSEEDARNQLVPITNYGLQKLFGEYMTTGAHTELGLNYLVVRPFNAVGSGELPHVSSEGEVEFGMAHVIPDFVYKALARQSPFQIFGDGEQVRTFTHAQDIAEAVALLVESNASGDDFNICGNNTYSVGALAEAVWSRVNPDLAFPGFEHLPVPPSDVRFRIGSSEKAKQRLGWSPRFDLDAIIDDTAAFVAGRMSPSA
jgi:nucleoside-diphosphate-sugar epimerase